MGNDYKLGCPCGFRPPRTDDLDAWQSWHDHLAEAHPSGDAPEQTTT